MYDFILTLHVSTVMLVIGTLFVESLTVVFCFRLGGSGADRVCKVDSAQSPSIDLLNNFD